LVNTNLKVNINHIVLMM